MPIQDFINGIIEFPYFHSLAILIGFFIIGKLLVFICEKWILKLTAKTKTKVDDLIVEKTNRPISLLLLFIGLKLALVPITVGVQFGFDIDFILGKIIESVIAVIVTYIIIIVFDIIIDQWGRVFAEKTKSHLDNQLISLFHRFSRIVLIILALLFILDLWGFKVGPFLASLGIAGIAIAFALQSTLANIFGGISMILDKSVKVGDVVRLDQETAGTVIDVGLRSTKIKSFNNEVIVMPNGKLVDSKIENFVLPEPSIRIVIPVGVEYGSDVEKVRKLLMDEIKKFKEIKVLDDPAPKVLFVEMADFSLNFSVRFYIESYKEKMKAKDIAVTAFYKALTNAGIGIPFPTRTVYMEKS